MEEIHGDKLRVNNQRHVTELFLRRRHSLSYSIFTAVFTKNSATIPYSEADELVHIFILCISLQKSQYGITITIAQYETALIIKFICKKITIFFIYNKIVCLISTAITSITKTYKHLLQ